MLKEIESNIFRTKKIQFHQGLNVILGDDIASNSIGKSTLLMIIDFIFGGETYTKYNKDVVDNVGHHSFYYMFQFNNEKYYFKRGTENSNFVYECDSKYNIVKELCLKEYTKTLKKLYGIESKYITFRSMVSLYCRVWGKDNYDIKKPLNINSKSKENEMVNNLIKVFNKYDNINDINKNIENYKKESSALNNGMKFDYIPKINKKKYKRNIKEMDEIKIKISLLEEKIDVFSTDISELKNDKIVELNNDKRQLSNKKSIYINRINRINNNILKKTNANKKQFEKLKEIFPSTNIDKLEKIEKFHRQICSFLNEEIKNQKNELEMKVSILDESISNIETEISSILNIKDIPKYVLETLVDLTLKLNILQKENEFFDKKEEVKNKLSEEKCSLKDKSKKIKEAIERTINLNMKLIYEELMDKPKKAPKLEITDNGYNFYIYDNTGAGNAYESLIILDLAIFKATNLPILIHDSMLFKNIEKETVEKLISKYDVFKRQIFISIDESFKYDIRYRDIIIEKTVINLDK